MNTRPIRFLSVALALVLGLSLSTPALSASVEQFPDVPENYWAKDAIAACAARGIVTGYDGKFNPEDNVTGVQFVSMLTRALYTSELEKVSVLDGQPWYYPHLTVAENLGISDSTLAFSDTNINRYDMARALYNIIVKEGKNVSADNTAYQNTVTAIKDYSEIPVNRLIAVRQCYALGILTGMSDETFSGNAYMTRAQACAVIVRMLNLIGGGVDSPAQVPTQEPEQTPEQIPEQTSGTLANGEPATVENVAAMLEELKEKYPDGYNYYAKFITHGNTNCGFNNLTCQWPFKTGGTVSTTSGCGGFAHMVSDTIFGESGAPARQVTDYTKLRPGDIIIQYTDKTKTKLIHVEIVTNVYTENGTVYYGAAGAGPDNGVNWSEGTKSNASWLTNPNMCSLAFTRYPD